ncbi:glycosyltransferase [Gracilibacillus thailandensis]|uniref:Glycosyltransferase n=1 Tax=Gracilibacillus thailandensis TaxID=563735 RepID=A0A6N7R1N5_9BACI|nr:glycosyltransferase family 2 protein [Gracilibacillus thailandensis]MRI67612.1 glycosyltransferase [Gracilibacillus thailandensis]
MLLKITLVLFLFYIFFQLLYILYPLYAVSKKQKATRLNQEKGITVIIPAYNEEKIILNCLEGIVNLQYHNYEIIFVNDGSNDNTLAILKKHLDLRPTFQKLPAVKIPHQEIKDIYHSELFPKIYLIDKVNGGKADALNTGTEYAAKEIVVTLDADSILDPNALNAINTTFADKDIIAAGGMVQIKQGFLGSILKPKPTFKLKGIIRYQIVQYMTAFYLHKLTQAKLNSIIVIAGAFGAFRKQALFDVNGYRKTVGEDMDITLKMHRLIKTNKNYRNSKLAFIPHAICYTECPESFSELYKQRIRWQKAFVDCVFYFKKSFFRQLGFRLSFFFIFESLLLGTLNVFPIMLIPIALIINSNHYMVAVALFSVTIFLSIYQSIVTIIVGERFGIIYSNKHLKKLIVFIPFETITYRLMGLLFVITGTFMYFRNKNSWHVSKRVGNSQHSIPIEVRQDKHAI